jgi:hypothetical protein
MLSSSLLYLAAALLFVAVVEAVDCARHHTNPLLAWSGDR